MKQIKEKNNGWLITRLYQEGLTKQNNRSIMDSNDSSLKKSKRSRTYYKININKNMLSKFKTIYVPIGHTQESKTYYFDSLREAMDDENTEGDEISEVINPQTENERRILTMYKTGKDKNAEHWDILFD